MGFRARYDAFDRFQRRHGWLGFPLAVRQKYSDDQCGFLAATITYYGFFSIFPLLLVATTLLGYVLRGHAHLQRRSSTRRSGSSRSSATTSSCTGCGAAR